MNTIAFSSNSFRRVVCSRRRVPTAVDHRNVQSSVAVTRDIDFDEAISRLIALTADVDRGLSASTAQHKEIRDYVADLEKQSKPVKLSWVAAGQVQCGMDLLDGVWKLIYTSAFESGNLGGSRPGPRAETAPVKLGPIYQRIDCEKALLDNVVELQAPPGAAQFLPAAPSVRACLRHTFSITGDSDVHIVYDSTSAKLLADGEEVRLWPGGPPVGLEPPALQRLLPESLRSASFKVTLLAPQLRVTRGDRGELRVYISDNSALPSSKGPDMPDPDTERPVQ